MPLYALRYIEGPNDALRVGPAEIVEAPSFAQALALRTPWPVMECYDHRSAYAQNPGTSLYSTETWEAVIIFDENNVGPAHATTNINNRQSACAALCRK